MDKIIELAERCEMASGLDRELDAVIARACGVRSISAKFNTKIDPDLELLWVGACGYALPAYTVSIDAAMTLVPEGWVPTITVYHDCASATLADDRVNPVRLDTIEIDANTASLAVCAAALRAKATSNA